MPARVPGIDLGAGLSDADPGDDPATGALMSSRLFSSMSSKLIWAAAEASARASLSETWFSVRRWRAGALRSSNWA